MYSTLDQHHSIGFLFRLNYLWSRLDTKSYRVVNIVLHAIVVLLSHEFFLVILSRSNNVATNSTASSDGNNNHSTDAIQAKQRVQRRIDIAAKWASLIFAAHPVHTECVSELMADLCSSLQQ